MTDETRFSMEGFTEHAQKIVQRFEQRRVEFLNKLKFRGVIACILLFTFPVWYSLLTRWDYLGEGLSSFGLFVVHVLAAIVIIIGISAFAVRPMFRYRYDALKIGSSSGKTVVDQPIDLKSQIFTQLLGYFGNFSMYNHRKLSLKSFRNAPNVPEFDECISEDYIRGQINGVGVEISEVSLLTRHDGIEQPVFRGIFIVLDINDPDLVLHGKFAGRTVAMTGRQSGNEFIVRKYDGYKHVTPLDSSLTQVVEAYTTHVEEAERLLTPELLRHVLKLSEGVHNAKNQERSVDDRLANALERIAGGIGDILAASAATTIHWFKTGSFNTRSSRHSAEIAAKTGALSGDVFNECTQWAFYDDKLLISIPGTQNLFEPDSVFHPPLIREDITLVYEMMTAIAGLTESVVSSLPKEMV